MGLAFWLTQAEYKLATWCDRQAEFEKNREDWTAADRLEHRSASSQLGLDPESRTRLPSERAPFLEERTFGRGLKGRRRVAMETTQRYTVRPEGRTRHNEPVVGDEGLPEAQATRSGPPPQ